MSKLDRALPAGLRGVIRGGFEKVALYFLRRVRHVPRSGLAHIYLDGEGIEFGAYNAPLPVPPGVTVRYADRFSNEFLFARHQDASVKPMPLTYVTSLETCEGIADESQDFIIANHVIEHLENPIQAIESMLRILKEGGIMYLAIPDRRYTFDFDRPLTTYEHLLRDYHEGPDWSRLDHYRDVARNLYGLSGEEADRFADELCEDGLDTHFHVWEQHTLMEMFLRLKTELKFPFDILMNSTFPNESIFILRKIDPERPLPRPETTSLFPMDEFKRKKEIERMAGK